MSVSFETKYLVIEKCFLIFIKNGRIDLELIENLLEENNLDRNQFVSLAYQFYLINKDSVIVKNLMDLIFNEAKWGLVNSDKLKEYALKYKLKDKQLRSILNNYLDSCFSLDNNKEFRSCISAFYRFIEKIKAVNYNWILKYYEKYANKDEKELLKNRLLEIIDEVLVINEKDLEINSYLEELGLNINGLYYLVTKCFSNNDLVLNRIAMLGKRYYDIYQDCNFLYRPYKETLKKLNIKGITVNLWLDLYMNRILGIKRGDIVRINFGKSSLRNNEKTKNLKAILETKDKDEIIRLFQKYEYARTDIQRFAYVFYYNIDKEVQKRIYDNLDKKYRFYRSYKGKYKNSVKESVVKEKIESKNIILEYKELALMIENGIYGRSFDIIDFYRYFPNLKQWIIFYNHNLTEKENYYIRTIFEKLRVVTFINEEDIINSHIENGGRTLDKEEIKKILDYLKSNKIPLYDLVFSVAVRRYMEGTLFENTLQR